MSEDLGSIIEFSEDIGDASEPDPLPSNTYPATIQSAEAKVSKNGNKYASVGFRVDPSDYPADFTEGNPDGTLLTYNRILLEDNPQARWRLRKFLDAIGAPMSKQIDLNAWVGLGATLETTIDEYDGEHRPQIAKVLPA